MNEILLESLELNNELMEYCIYESKSIKNTLDHIIRKTKIFLKKIVTTILNIIDENIFAYKTINSSNTIKSMKKLSTQPTKSVVVEVYDDLTLKFHTNILKNLKEDISKAPDSFINYIIDKDEHQFNEEMNKIAKESFKQMTLSSPDGITVSNLHSELKKIANRKTKVELTETHVKLYKGANNIQELKFMTKGEKKIPGDKIRDFVWSSEHLVMYSSASHNLKVLIRREYINSLKELDRIYTYAIKNTETKKDEELAKKKLLYQTKYINNIFIIRMACASYYMTASNNYIKNFKIITKALKEKIE